jgi:hypothetical protein
MKEPAMPTSNEAFREETRELSLLIQEGDARLAARRPAPPAQRPGLFRRIATAFATGSAGGRPATSSK